MIENGIGAWGVLLALVLLASAAGCAVASFWSWTSVARHALLPLMWGCGLGPLLLGLAAVGVLQFAPGAGHGSHLAAVFAILSVPVAWLFFSRANATHTLRPPDSELCPKMAEKILLALLVAWLVGLFADAVFIPLTQNDSLEYATVGRILFEARSLSAYPAIDPTAGTSGFYGPWTHPPLYVALIYMMQVIQGHAEAPGLMRVVAPWALAAATGLVFAMGAMISRATGLLSALVFIAAPLLFLGAESALIDGLPVLGLTLVLAACFGLRNSALGRGVGIGMALGLALWSHSQAVLFIPLAVAAVFIYRSRRDWRAALVEVAVLVAVALLVAVWPYARNMTLFGSPISDNPIVFALPEQAWPDYFRIARGVDYWPAIIQYGWFKGWFALEAFGLAFWLMLWGAGVYLLTWRRQGGAGIPVLTVAGGIVLCYLAGVVASSLIGLDLMIKNERYLLVILPPVSLLAGYGLARAMAWRRLASGAVLTVVLLVFSVQLTMLVVFRFTGNGLGLSTLGRSFETTLKGRPEYLVMDYLRTSTPPDALVFSLKPADMYYAHRRMLSYLDPRLVPFYREQDPARALALLRGLGVTHVHVPDYGLPPLYNSVIQQVLRNPLWAELLFQADGNQIYTLRPSGLTELPGRDIGPLAEPWLRSAGLVIGGRKALASIGGAGAVMVANTSQGGLPMQLFHRDWSTSLTVGAGASSPLQSPSASLALEGGREYAIDLELKGRGLVRIWLQQFDGQGQPLKGEHLRSQSRMMLSDVVLGDTYPQRSFTRRFHSHERARRFTLTLEHVGSSHIQILQAQLAPLRK